ncbi:MAG TPA: CHRD domain-containing protein [Streptosporangiaceae bacterium]|nr:CHRD domain-containing protein [Streptosporangiaceae bacterium]
MSFTACTSRGAGANGRRHRIRDRMPRRSRIRLGAGAAASGALAAVAVLTLAASAGGSTSSAGPLGSATVHGITPAVYSLRLRAMPAGTVTFGRRHGRLTVHAVMFGLTPGSSHSVNLLMPGRFGIIWFSRLTANTVGQANSTLQSHFTGHLPRGSRLLIRMGVGSGRVAREPITETGRLRVPGRQPHPLIPVEVGPGGADFGTPRGRAAISYNAHRHTLTVTVHASGLTPGPHAAHIHLGSCVSQGPVKYMLRALIANSRGKIVHAVRVFTNVTTPVPAHGWYLNIHQGNSSNILSNGQPTIFFRPLLCADVSGSGSVSSILRTGDIVTGVRGMGHGNVVLTGSAAIGNGAQAAPSLYRGSLERAAGAAVSVLTPSFPGVTSATFYGPDTHSFNPTSIPRGQVRAVGSYQSSSAPAGVINQGMIYLGPVSGSGGSWTSLDVPADGTDTAGHVRACPRTRVDCFVMDTIAHSTMGDLVVGNYDLNPSVRGGVVSGNAFIYNMARYQWTLLRLGGSLSSQTTLYGIWQDGGGTSPHYTLAGGSAASGGKRAFLMDYNERTGRFGAPKYYSYDNRPAAVTHFEGVTAAPGGFNLVAMSSAQAASMAFIPVHARNGSFGPATWYPVKVMTSPLCSAGCSLVTGNAVYKNHVMGLYIPTSSAAPHTYLAAVSRR